MMRIFILMLALALICSGACFAQQEGQKQFKPRKVQVDSNYDGKIDRIEAYDEFGQIDMVESDSNGNGKMDEWIMYKDGKPVKKEKDTNEDGKADMWVDY